MELEYTNQIYNKKLVEKACNTVNKILVIVHDMENYKIAPLWTDSEEYSRLVNDINTDGVYFVLTQDDGFIYEQDENRNLSMGYTTIRQVLIGLSHDEMNELVMNLTLKAVAATQEMVKKDPETLETIEFITKENICISLCSQITQNMCKSKELVEHRKENYENYNERYCIKLEKAI